MMQRTITFVSYYKHQSRVFSLIEQQLPPSIRARQMNIYHLTVESLLQSPSTDTGLSQETIDDIIHFYHLKKSLAHPGWDTMGWRKHLKRRAAQWYHLFRRKLTATDLVVVWNGFSIPLRAAVAATQAIGVKTAFCENGVLPNTMAIDPKGINYANSLTGKSASFFSQRDIDPQRAEQLLKTSLQQRPLRKAGGDIAEGCDDDKSLPARYVLFAMQVHDDTQVLLFSPRFRSMEDAVPYVWEQIQAYNARTGDNLALVVKEHPSDYGRANYQAMRAAMPGTFFLRSTPISAIIGQAKAVITLNSSVGVEGLLYLRPVITLGDAFYNIPGVTYHLNAQHELAELLSEVIDRPVNAELITKFLYFLRYEYLIPSSPKQLTPDGAEAAAQRILDIVTDQLRWA